jgi:hypothetical protein
VQSASEHDTPVNAKAVLVDPRSMSVSWMNESADQDYSKGGSDFVPGLPLDQAVPMAESLGLPEAVRSVADTGIPRHAQANLVSTSKGNVAIVTSVYLLPDGMVLMLTENAWQPGHRRSDGSVPKRSRRRAP